MSLKLFGNEGKDKRLPPVFFVFVSLFFCNLKKNLV